MTFYSAPTDFVSIFDPAMFQNTRFSNITANPVGSQYLLFPNAQGAETFGFGTNSTLNLSSVGINLNTNLLSVPTGIAFNASGFAYNSGANISTISWTNLITKIQAIAPLSSAPNATTLAVNNAISIQNGETVDNPTQVIELIADNSGNRLLLDGDAGSPNNVLVSGGADGSLFWGTGGGALVGNLAEVMNNGNTASKDILMSNHNISNANNIDAKSISLTTTLNTANLTSAVSSIPITINGTVYYLQLFQNT